MSNAGRVILLNLYNNRAVVEKELDRFYYGHRYPMSYLVACLFKPFGRPLGYPSV